MRRIAGSRFAGAKVFRLGGLVYPLRKAAAVFFEKERANPETFADDAVRGGVANGAGDPLPADFILRGREPTLRQDLHQSGVKVEDE